MTHKTYTRLLILAGVILLGSSEVFACTCGLPNFDMRLRKWAAKQSRRVDVIFTGTVVSEYYAASQDDDRTRHAYVFDVDEVFKGSAAKQVEMESGTICIASFSVGGRYLIFAYENEGELSTGLCSGNGLVADMGYAIRYLKNQPPLTSDRRTIAQYLSRHREGTLCGELLTLNADADIGSPVIHFLPEDSPFGYWLPFTYPAGENGTFCETLPVGQYWVSAISSGTSDDTPWVGLYGRTPETREGSTVSVVPDQTIRNINLTMTPPSTVMISGRVMIGDRPLLPDESIEVRLISSRSLGDHLRPPTGTSKESRFVFENVPEDLYYLVVIYQGPNGLEFTEGLQVILGFQDTSNILVGLPEVKR